MNPRTLKAWIATLTVIAVATILFLLFPRALAFLEMAALELRYFWWLVLLVALALFLIFGLGKKRG